MAAGLSEGACWILLNGVLGWTVTGFWREVFDNFFSGVETEQEVDAELDILRAAPRIVTDDFLVIDDGELDFLVSDDGEFSFLFSANGELDFLVSGNSQMKIK